MSPVIAFRKKTQFKAACVNEPLDIDQEIT